MAHAAIWDCIIFRIIVVFSLGQGCWQWVRGAPCGGLRPGWAQPLTLRTTVPAPPSLSFPICKYPFGPGGLQPWESHFLVPSLSPAIIHAFLPQVFIERLLYARGQQSLGCPSPVISCRCWRIPPTPPAKCGTILEGSVGPGRPLVARWGGRRESGHPVPPTAPKGPALGPSKTRLSCPGLPSSRTHPYASTHLRLRASRRSPSAFLC